jgi:hypothetical protein
MRAFLLLRLVNKIPVNMIREASKRTPPIAYFTFVFHDLCAAVETACLLPPEVVEERRACIASPSVQRSESRLEQDSV